MNRAVSKRIFMVALILGAIPATGCQDDVTGPDPLSEEQALERRLEQAGFAECLAEFRRVRSSLAGLSRAELLAELRRIVRTCFSAGGSIEIGSLAVSTVTTGEDPDPAYVITIPDHARRAIQGSEVARFDIAPGDYQVQLSGVAENCTVAGENPRAVSVNANGVVTLIFEVSCTGIGAAPGNGRIVFSAFASFGGGASRDLFLVNVDGTGLVNLTNTGNLWESSPDFSPDGSTIVFESFSTNNDIHSIRSVGSGRIALTTTPEYENVPSFGPGGERVAFERDLGEGSGRLDIHVMNSDGTNQVRVTNHPADDENVDWSPDGARLVFQSERDGNEEIYVMDADGSNPVRLTNHPARDLLPAWSPDGARIAFFSDRDDFAFEIYVMNADGSNVQRLTNHFGATDSSPDWSPDGSQIVFESVRNGQRGIYVMNADGSDLTKVIDHLNSETGPTWGP